MKPHGLWTVILLMVCASPALAIPPIVSGDVPTAPDGIYELFVGYIRVEGDRVTVSEIPFWELVYGLTPRLELTIEGPVLLLDGPTGSTVGLGDVVLGTKVRLLGKPEADSGLSASLEVKLPTGDDTRGLGSGATNVDLRTRWGWEVGREVVYFNLGYTWVGERGDEELDNTWFYSGVWDHPLGQKMRLLTEVYGKTSDDPEGPCKLAASVGFKWRVLPKQQFQASLGRSLRGDAEGGPKLRSYIGWRWDF
ncbi:MAG: transporter [Gemmatimonadetes bacterium]|nr:transporter [Gemmatimonadota bacterium]